MTHEIARAARADGVELDPAAILAILDQLPDGMRSSMQKDAAAGRPIELDAIGGTILRAADRAGTQAPVTAGLVADLRRAVRLAPGGAHSHSIVPGGLEVTS